jgi:hypothetical protein
MLFLSLLALYDECRSGVTIQLTATPKILKREYNFPSAGSLFCLNFTVPNLAISFLQKANASVQVFRTVGSSSFVVFNSTFEDQPLSVADFGDDVGMIMIRALTLSQLIYSTISWPDDCESRVLSNRESDFFAVDDQCEHDGCVEPGSTICYFNSLHSESLYAIEVDLRHEHSLVAVFSASGEPIRNFRNRESYSLAVGPSSEPVYFTIFNGNDEDILARSVSITSSSFGISDDVRAYYDHNPRGIALFFEQPHDNSGIPIGADFTMTALLFFCLVLAALTYMFLHRDPAELAERAGAQSELADSADPQRKQYTVVASGDENAEGLPLEDLS